MLTVALFAGCLPYTKDSNQGLGDFMTFLHPFLRTCAILYGAIVINRFSSF